MGRRRRLDPPPTPAESEYEAEVDRVTIEILAGADPHEAVRRGRGQPTLAEQEGESGPTIRVEALLPESIVELVDDLGKRLGVRGRNRVLIRAVRALEASLAEDPPVAASPPRKRGGGPP